MLGVQVSKRDQLRRDILHLLCTEPLSHSQVVKKLPRMEDSGEMLDSVLDEIAELKLSTKNTVRKVYYLRPGQVQQVNNIQ